MGASPSVTAVARVPCESIKNYYNSLPPKVLHNTALSFIGSLLLSTAYSGSIAVGIIGSSIGAISQIIHVTTAPIFRKLAEKMNVDPNNFPFWFEFLRRAMIVSLTIGIFCLFTTYRVNWIATLILLGLQMAISTFSSSLPPNQTVPFLIT